MTAISTLCFPTSVEFQLRLDIMVAVFKRGDWGYDLHSPSYLRPNGKPVAPPPNEFTYTPPGLVTPSPKSTGPEYVGWTLCTIATNMHDKGLKTNWSPPDAHTKRTEPLSEALSARENTWAVTLGPQYVPEFSGPEYAWVSVRLTSPVFTESQNAPDVKRQLQITLEILNKTFITFAHSKSRLQVLVKPAGSGFRVSQLKKIASLLWVADPLLSKVHPPHCGPGSPASLGLQFTPLAQHLEEIDLTVHGKLANAVEDPWNNRLAERLQPLMMLPHPGELSEPQFGQGLHKIRRVTELSELLNLLDIIPIHYGNDPFLKHPGPFDPAYDFGNFKDDAEQAMIRFNQHCGTLDLEAILYWTSICTRIVASSLDEPTKTFNKALLTLRNSIRLGKGSLTEFLSRLGIPSTSDYYQSRDVELQIPDFKDWPLLRKAIPDDDSEPKIEAELAYLYHSGAMNTEDPQENETLRKALLLQLGESMRLWHGPAITNNPDSRYTFGIELEMLIPVMGAVDSGDGLEGDDDSPNAKTTACDYADPRDPQPEDDRMYGHSKGTARAKQLAVLLEGVGCPARCGGGGMVKQYNREEYLRSQKLLPLKRYKIDYQSWAILDDTSLTNCRQWKGYDQLLGIECASPVYRDKPECWEAILKVISTFRSNMRIAVDDTCGFHVSVGTGDKLMEYHFLRKLACLMFVADRLIFSLCNPKRKIAGTYCRSLREQSILLQQLCDEWRQVPPTSDFVQCFPVDELSADDIALLNRLWTMVYINDLRNSLCGPDHGRSSVSFNRILGTCEHALAPKYCHGSVEFRYLQGSLDPELVIRFSQLMVGLFKFADTAKPEAWRPLTSTLLKCKDAWDYDFDILRQTLKHLDMADHYDYWVAVARENRRKAPEIERQEVMRQRSCLDHADSQAAEQERLASIEIIPKLPQHKFESIQKDLCWQERYTAYAKEKPGDVLPKAVPIDARADLQNRVQTLFESMGIPANAVGKAIQNIESTGKKMENFTESCVKKRLLELNNAHQVSASTSSGKLGMAQAIEQCSAASASSGIEGVLEAVKKNGKQLETGEDAEVSRQEMATFLDLEGSCESNGAFMFESFSKIEGEPLEVHITEEDWERFLS